jgi:hypothetical protein
MYLDHGHVVGSVSDTQSDVVWVILLYHSDHLSLFWSEWGSRVWRERGKGKGKGERGKGKGERGRGLPFAWETRDNK